MKYSFTNWKRYQPSGKAVYTDIWFKLRSDFITSEVAAGLSAGGFKCVIYLISEACRAGRGGEFSVQKTHANFVLRENHTELESTIAYLIEIGELIESGFNSELNSGLNPAGKKERTNKQTKELGGESLPGLTCGGRDLLGKVKPDLVAALISQYSASRVEEEVNKAAVWVVANPGKAPKRNHGRFLASWMSRSEEYRKTQPRANVEAKQASWSPDILGLYDRLGDGGDK